MKVFFNNTNLYNVGFQAGVKSPKVDSRTKLNIALTQDTVQLMKKKKFTEKQLEKIRQFANNRPIEVQDVYNEGVKYLNKEIKSSDFIKKLGKASNDILENKVKLTKSEARYLSDMAESTDLFNPAEINDEYFQKITDKLLMSIKK